MSLQKSMPVQKYMFVFGGVASLPQVTSCLLNRCSHHRGLLLDTGHFCKENIEPECINVVEIVRLHAGDW